MTTRTRLLTTSALAASLALGTLTGCGSDNDGAPAQITNVPSAEAGNEASPGSTVQRDEATAKRVMDTTTKTAKTAPKLLRESNAAVQKKIVDPLYSGESSAMPWVTLLAVGARVDDASITTEDGGLFTANVVDPQTGETLAQIEGVVRGTGIKPVNYQETGAGEDFRSAHVSESRKWATN